eukprot:5944736-Prymnesium_polylepis.1
MLLSLAAIALPLCAAVLTPPGPGRVGPDRSSYFLYQPPATRRMPATPDQSADANCSKIYERFPSSPPPPQGKHDISLAARRRAASTRRASTGNAAPTLVPSPPSPAPQSPRRILGGAASRMASSTTVSRPAPQATVPQGPPASQATVPQGPPDPSSALVTTSSPPAAPAEPSGGDGAQVGPSGAGGGTSGGASLDELRRCKDEASLKRAFKRCAATLHPDVNDAADAVDQFQELTA